MSPCDIVTRMVFEHGLRVLRPIIPGSSGASSGRSDRPRGGRSVRVGFSEWSRVSRSRVEREAVPGTAAPGPVLIGSLREQPIALFNRRVNGIRAAQIVRYGSARYSFRAVQGGENSMPMGRAVFALTMGVLTMTAVAHAGPSFPIIKMTTYRIATTRSYVGTIGGTITGDGESIQSWNLLVTYGGVTHDLRSGGGMWGVSEESLPDQNGRAVMGYTLDDPYMTLAFVVTGNFDSGLGYAGDQAITYWPFGRTVPHATAWVGDVWSPYSTATMVAQDDISFTRVPPSSVPEPGSLGVLALGIIGISVTRHRRTRGLSPAFG